MSGGKAEERKSLDGGERKCMNDSMRDGFVNGCVCRLILSCLFKWGRTMLLLKNRRS